MRRTSALGQVELPLFSQMMMTALAEDRKAMNNLEDKVDYVRADDTL